MQNYVYTRDMPRFYIQVSAIWPNTTVTVRVPTLNFMQKQVLEAGEGSTIHLPKDVEMYGTQKLGKTVLIESTQEVLVQSLNFKMYTADTAVLYPVSAWGTEYLVFSPVVNYLGVFPEFSIINHKEQNTVDIIPQVVIVFEGQSYRPGSKLTIELEPYQSVQLQSVNDLTNTKVVSKLPVAVFVGHSCYIKFTKCNHVFEQLIPVKSWGTNFLVPPLSFQDKYDNVYIQASMSTCLTVTSGGVSQDITIGQGQSQEFNLVTPNTIYINANKGIQVFFLFNGALQSSGVEFDPFLMSILPTDNFCTSYILNGQSDFDNFALFLVQTRDLGGLLFDGAPLPKNLQWRIVNGSEYSWAEMPYSSGAGQHKAEHRTSPFGLYSMGVSLKNGYGAPALCSKPGVLQPPRSKMGTCWARGDPHYFTFDGRYFDFMGTCTYILSKNCQNNGSLPLFQVEAQNDNRGNILVSFVALVTVKVYNVTISVARSEVGHVRLDYGIWSLPVIIDKVQIFQTGRFVVIQTDFNLIVKYDWDQNLVISLPDDYKDKVCGLCGNFNGNPSDDFATPSGTQAASIVEFGRSWKVLELSPAASCQDDCPGQCQCIGNSMLNTWKGDLFCGLLTRIPDGPFRLCHATIDPKPYLENCVFDLCLGGGLSLYLCNALEAYATACQHAGIEVYNWREISGCSAKCPENSYYESCGSACPATCSDHFAPSTCKYSCVETCTCNASFVLSGGKCVPAARCGCTYQGRSISPGDSFWADQACLKFCYCNPINSQLECRDSGCRAGERCGVVNGIRGCQPISYSRCSATGDPHYVSFDGTRFDFQGTCVYQLVGVCSKDPALEPFQVLVQNNFRGSTVVSYTKIVEIKVYNVSIVISKDKPNQIMVNGLLTLLPVYLDGIQVSIYKSGLNAVVKTSFNLMVSFDWNSAVFVTLPSTYAGSVCGLCGNFNSNPRDDLTMKNGQLTPNPTDFGRSWLVEEIPGCVHSCTGVCTVCDTTQKQQYGSNTFCGLLRDPNGPFRNCHAIVDPSGYFEDCVYDVCLYKGKRDMLCQAITAYMSVCQDSGAKVEAWRAKQSCDVKCPANSHYEVCSTGCPATCYSLSSPFACSAPCREGCTCNDGFILSGTLCVPFSQCGCLYNGTYYKVGDILPSMACQEECKCTQFNKVQCQAFSCGPNERCEVVDGIQKCQPVGTGVCSASGDPHYKSFDGLLYDFQGTCTYTLAKACGLEGMRLVPFEVQVENEKWWPQLPNRKVSVSKLVALEVYGYVLILQKNMLGVMVNGVFSNLPLNLNNSAVVVYNDGSNYVMQTNFSLVVTYDLVYHVTVTVPGNYRTKTCGLCGNFNGDKTDDFRFPNGTLTKDINTFGTAWKVAIPGVMCDNGCSGNTCPDCLPGLKAIFENPSYCGILKVPNGPFSACYNKLDPTPYFNDCVYDLCASDGNRKVVCDTSSAYVYNCQRAGIRIDSWRTPYFCPMSCPPNSHYEICAYTCSMACAGVSDITSCPTMCSEGCTCNPGFVFNGQGCVLPDQCSCYENGHTYKPGEVVYEDECTRRCMCDTTKGLLCETYTCPSGTKCTVQNGVKACFHTDPCRDKNCRVKETCVVKNNEAVCFPQYTGTCWASGDPHYHTFDGYNYDFQGTCTYTISATCGNLTGLVPFSIKERNDNRGSSLVSYIRDVEVSVYSFNITMGNYQYGRIMVNGVVQNLPVYLTDKLSVSQVGNMAVLQTDFGLYVSYDWFWQLVVQLPSSYYNSVCGLCGNFNGNRSDDIRDPAGNMLSSVVNWAKSWRVEDPDNLFCWDTCKTECPTCDNNLVRLYQAEAYCGALTNSVNGLFQQCHGTVDPQVYMNNCVYDVCVNKGDKTTLCQALASYSDMCRREGIVIKGWREKSGCPMNCQPHSHYDPCASPCSLSCPFPERQPTCTGTCIEACVCDDGYVLSAGQCMPAASCGCSYQGCYYKPLERFWLEGCQQQCECDPTFRTVVCWNAACGPGEQCSVQDGTRACRPISYATCTAAGDPHYLTFDGYHFDFQGTCMYQLVGLCSKESRLTSFNVTVQNDNRANRAVAFTKVVTVELSSITVTLSKDYPYKILVNGQAVCLPFYNDKKLMVFRSGQTAVLETDFGLRLTFDWNSVVHITLPSTYQNAVCGLCGNYNGNASDDRTMRSGALAPGEVQLGSSWQVGIASGCSSECTGPSCKVCSSSQREAYRAPQYCGFIMDPAGPFKACHAYVNPMSYMQDCMFDACQYQGYYVAVCDAIAAYVSACQSMGVTIQPWRNSSFCPMTCPVNSHYELCPTGCPATCARLPAPARCGVLCREGCQCNDGHLLSGDVCVPVAQCGCTYGERYYKKGDIFYTQANCQEQCQCGDNGAVSCQASQCRLGEACQLAKGVQGCHPTGFAKCIASGDPHYISFDGRWFDFQGTCIYILAKVCNDSQGLTPFTVQEDNVKFGNGKVAVTRGVTIQVYGYTVSIKQGMRWAVLVDEDLLNLPFSLNGGRIIVNQEGLNIVVQTDFGLQVLYDTTYYVVVTVPSTYQGNMCGLCGNYNGNGLDDFRLPTGQQVSDVDTFGKSWAAGQPETLCGGCGGQCPMCSQDKRVQYSQPNSCGIISTANGPFSDCHAKVGPQPYFQHCVFDVCALNGDNTTLCKSIQAYAIACQNAGVQIQPWRTNTFCSITCPINSHYELCANTCGTSCASLTMPNTCSNQCFEGCQCDSGFVSNGNSCVSMNSCGCIYEGQYLKVGQYVVNKVCSDRCGCQPSGIAVCEAISCANGKVCSTQDGVRGCYVKEGICRVRQGGLVTSFDGMEGTLDLDGAYDLSFLCDRNSAQWFRIAVGIHNQNGILGISAVFVFCLDTTIVISSRQTSVNGKNVTMPITLKNGISISVKDNVEVTHTSGELRVSFSAAQGVKVTVGSSLAGKLCGACGNYNGNSRDDLPEIGTSVSEAINSWRVLDLFA
ncbi:IgGFc-binding protein isoform X1 [Scleropages formosus]|uniref:IgGFc-binding protein isoform X1 n=1 Tax=Scleropages formosus TaxID=113540 RepID=UPI0010FA82AB|nr:IgGFc-binding protein-like isoform X1 [Scleropages formosus]XP_018601006.2 IgGFc-binding protein-like isoform X1 [Scleropages formosus]